MAKNKISEYSVTSADNTDISNINIAEGCSPANVNNAIRTVMAQLKDFQSGNATYYTSNSDALAVGAGGTGAITAASARSNLSAASSGANSDITSLTACTSITGLTTPLSVSQGGTGVQVTRTISSVALTSNVVTITTSAAHGYLASDSVTVTATTQTTVNGTYTIISIPTSTTFTYAKTASNISPIADTGSVVSSSNIKMSAASGVLSVANGGTGSTTLTANSVVLGNGTSALSSNLIAPGTSGNVLTSNGTTWESSVSTSTGAGTLTATGQTFTITTGAKGKCLINLSAGYIATFGSFGTCTANLVIGGTTVATDTARTMEYDARTTGDHAIIAYQYSGSANASVTVTFTTTFSGTFNKAFYSFIGS